jgi:hypothetical protein
MVHPCAFASAWHVAVGRERSRLNPECFRHAQGCHRARHECQRRNEPHRRLQAEGIGDDAGQQRTDRIAEITPQSIHSHG